MKRSTVLTEKNRGTWATVFLALILLPVALSLLKPLWAQEPQVFLEPADARWESCIRDAEYMRYHHMDLLRDAREDVIRSGLKGGITLAGCGDCHHNRDRFCDRCHEKASVTLDCWGCHYYLTDSEIRELEAHQGGVKDEQTRLPAEERGGGGGSIRRSESPGPERLRRRDGPGPQPVGRHQVGHGHRYEPV